MVKHGIPESGCNKKAAQKAAPSQEEHSRPMEDRNQRRRSYSFGKVTLDQLPRAIQPSFPQESD
jgi:hypothetical protein